MGGRYFFFLILFNWNEILTLLEKIWIRELDHSHSIMKLEADQDFLQPNS